MTERSRQLLEVAAQYVVDHPHPGMIAAYAGGSVGRGTADAYSDIDLMIYHRAAYEGPHASNTTYFGEVVQVNHQTFPTESDLYADPWSFRFLVDGECVYDPSGEFDSFKSSVTKYLASKAGRDRILDDVRNIVRSRATWTRSSLDEGKLHTAGMGAMAAVTDAALLYGFMGAGMTSTGNPLKAIVDLAEVSEEIVSVCPVPRDVSTDRL